ncbi:hypothetical protein EYF80_012469 [Liparis tanakae]|uniref:Uncharacterized protein n=1 Tax=Liparis tanakae TaxID=230148 RepID=A0A4Z2II40_9TELE|nr:hypothetical protein EYF80_012469 [Liparis tanakae]
MLFPTVGWWRSSPPFKSHDHESFCLKTQQGEETNQPAAKITSDANVHGNNTARSSVFSHYKTGSNVSRKKKNTVYHSALAQERWELKGA